MVDKNSTTFCYAYDVNNSGHVASYGTINVTSWYETVDMTMTNTELVNAACPGVTSGPVKSGTNKVVVYASAVGTQGTATVTLSCPETANYRAGNVTCTVTVRGHNPVYDSEDPVRTCTSNGLKHYYCSYCKNHTTSSTSALGHSMASKVIKAATCSSGGTTRYYCTRCGYYYDVDGTPGAKGHELGGWDYSWDSSHAKWCKTCNTKILSEGHTYTLTKKGSCCGSTYTCHKCGHSECRGGLPQSCGRKGYKRFQSGTKQVFDHYIPGTSVAIYKTVKTYKTVCSCCGR